MKPSETGLPSEMPWWIRPLVASLLPGALYWARREERRIVREGRPLTEQERRDARDVGVRIPEWVRVLPVPRVPLPGGRLGQAWVTWASGPGVVAGMALGYGIYVDVSAVGSRHLLAHELAHVAQYERLGGVKPFMRRYLEECLWAGYHAADLELEAVELATRVCR